MRHHVTKIDGFSYVVTIAQWTDCYKFPWVVCENASNLRMNTKLRDSNNKTGLNRSAHYT